MKKTVKIFIITGLLFICGLSLAQDWNLKLKSKVELRSWKLTSKAIKNETFLTGATISLYKANVLVSQTKSDTEGNFEISIPPNGDYTLIITNEGCNPKKFAVNTKSVPPKTGDANFKPSVHIVGFIMSKPIKGVNYLGLNEPLLTVEYNSDKNSFAKNEQTAGKGLNMMSNIYDAEYRVIQKFCTANKLGDMALEKKNYSLAKTFYLMAMDMMDGETYPKTQLKKAEEGLKNEKVANNSKKSKSKKDKGKTGTDNEKIIAKPTKEAEYKNSRETGKSKHKIARTLGSK